MEVKAWLHERLCLGSHEQLPELSDESLKVLTRVAEAAIEEEKRETWLVRRPTDMTVVVVAFYCVVFFASSLK